MLQPFSFKRKKFYNFIAVCEKKRKKKLVMNMHASVGEENMRRKVYLAGGYGEIRSTKMSKKIRFNLISWCAPNAQDNPGHFILSLALI
jgi:hypothetical protein